MRTLVSALSVASILLGNICFTQIAAAMSMPAPQQSVAQSQEGLLMTSMMPMSMASTAMSAVPRHVSAPTMPSPSGCPMNGTCLLPDLAKGREADLSALAAEIHGAASLPAAVPDAANTHTRQDREPTNPMAHLAAAIATVMLRV